MPKPSAVPDWATAGGGAIVEPSAGKKSSGWVAAERPPAQHLNWLQNLAGQWAAWLRDLFDANGEHVYPTPIANRKIILSPHLGRAHAVGGGSAWDTDGGIEEMVSRVNSGLLVFDLNRFIPHGAFPTAIKALVLPGAARTGTNRLRLRLLTRNLNFDTPAAPASVEIASAFDDGTAVLQVIALSGFGGLFVDSADYLYRVELKAGNTGAAAPDLFAGLEVTFEDHGLRNT